MNSLIFYLFLLCVLLFLCRQNSDQTRQKKGIIASYFILFVVAGIRFGIGNDYTGYAWDCIYMSQWFSSDRSILDGIKFFSEDVEVSHIIICWLCRWMEYPFVGLYIIYSLIQVFLLYEILRRNNEHFWGIFIFIIGEFMFCSWDALRQFTAVLICVYSYGFAKDGKYLKFILCVVLAYSFHHTALFIAPVFLLRWVKVKRWILISVLLFVTALSVSGILQQYQQLIAVYFYSIDEYSGYMDNASTVLLATSWNYRIRLLLMGVVYSTILYFYPRKDDFYPLLLTIGVSIFIFACNSLTFLRMSWYMWAVVVLMIGPAIREINGKSHRWVTALMLFLLVGIFSHDVITGSNARGCHNYTTILTNNLNHLPHQK